MKIRSKKGYTLMEVLVAVVISVTLFASMIAAFLMVKSMNMMVRHKIQAIQVVRGQLENLKAGAFDDIVESAVAASYDAGADGVYGTVDDMQGTLTTAVRDSMDFDGDGNVAEQFISVDGDATNETNARPVRVSFAWSERTMGLDRNMNVFLDTIISQ